MSSLNSRILRLQEQAQRLSLDAVYIRNLSNIRWASDFSDVFDSEDAHALLIVPGKIVVHSDSRYVEALKQAAQGTGIEISIAKKSHFEYLLSLVEFSQGKTRALDASDMGNIKKLKSFTASVLRIGVEDSISLREFRLCERKVLESQIDVELVELTGFVERLREVKDNEEIALMRKAQSITDQAFQHIIGYIQPGMTEKHIQRELENVLFSLGADGLAFPSIVASGARGALPHSIPGDEPVQVGECVVMDFGASYKGYCSDMTRTVFIGQPSEKMRQAWHTLVKANETCEAMIRAGVVASEVHKKAEEVLAQGGFEGAMGHSLGHSVGIDVHETPVLSPSNHDVLRCGNVVTVEPGIYLEHEFGMRLEDFGVVGEHSFELLTQSGHDMVIIDPCK